MPTLSIRSGTGQATELPLERPLYSVGRSADNDIVLEGAGVSRHHCAIEFDGKHHYVRDLESHNGVYVNGALVDRAELRPRDEIRIGSTVLVYEPESDPITESHGELLQCQFHVGHR